MMMPPPDLRGRKRRSSGATEGGEEDEAASAVVAVDSPLPPPHPDEPETTMAVVAVGGRSLRGSETASSNMRLRVDSDGSGGSDSNGSSDLDSDSDSDPHDGYGAYVRDGRSVLYHPAGLPLVWALHSSQAPESGGGDNASEDAFPLVKTYFPDFFADNGGDAPSAVAVADASASSDGGPDSSAAGTVDSLFQRCHASWRSEADTPPTDKALVAGRLASKLAAAMGATLKDSNLTVTGEAQVQNPMTGHTGRIDILVSDQGADNTNRPLLLVEVGLHNVLWWAKLDLALRYLRYQATFALAEAVLLAVVTVEDEVGHDNTVARLGVFLITPKVVEDTFEGGVRQTWMEFRLSLLWHHSTEGISDLSKGFGNILRAACQLPGFLGAARAMVDRGDYRCLGPNCCRIKVKGDEKLVLRSYDNRARYTERRPDVYLYSGVTGSTEIVCDMHAAVGRTEPSDRDFGTRHLWSNTLAWLWKTDRKTSSRLLVIATPFREGNHYATSPRDFVPVVEHLEQLHAAGYVHGDIRCFNLAIGPKGGLFDFDLGGKLQEGDEGTTGVLKYPYGYNPAVRDGTRLGNAGEPITKFHDVYALTKVIFRLHIFEPSKNKEERAELAITTLSNEDSRVDMLSAAEALSETKLLLHKEVLSNFGDPRKDYIKLSATEIEAKISTHMAEVKRFLENAAAQQWIVQLQSAFEVELMKYDAIRPGEKSA